MSSFEGIRPLRLLARGARCELVLAHPGEPGEPAEPVVVKIDRAPGATARATRELAALERAAGAHVVRALDAATAGAAAAIVLERLPGPDLVSLLGARASWRAGEVVTVLQPIAATLARLHAAGVGHGAVAAGHVVFDGTGAPTLVGLGAAELFPPGAPEVELAARPAVGADRAAFRALALDLVRRVDDAAATAFAELVAARPDESLLPWFAAAVFDLADPVPVGIPVEGSRSGALGGRAVGVLALDDARADPAEAAGAAVAPAGGLVALLAGVVPDAWRERIADAARRSAAVEPVATILAAGRERWRRASPRARRVLVAGIAAVATVVIATAALRTVDAPAGGGVAGLPPDPGDSAGAASSGATAGGPETGAGATGSGDAGAGSTGAALGDDPVAAAAALLVARARCFAELSTGCLAAVDHAGSVQWERDRAAIEAVRAGDPEPAGAADALALAATDGLELVEGFGGAALVAVRPVSPEPSRDPETAPASLLIVRSEAGWRIRELVAGG